MVADGQRRVMVVGAPLQATVAGGIRRRVATAAVLHMAADRLTVVDRTVAARMVVDMGGKTMLDSFQLSKAA
jgi:hypothetical protein